MATVLRPPGGAKTYSGDGIDVLARRGVYLVDDAAACSHRRGRSGC